MSGRRGLILAVLAGALVASAGAAWLHAALTRPWAGWSGDAVEVTLDPGMTAGAMMERLAELGVVRHPAALRIWLRVADRSGGLQAGEYRFDRPLSALAVLERLERGEVTLHPITLPEGLTLAEVAERLVAAGFGVDDELIAAFRVPLLIADIDPVAEDLEGYLFPDTYRFPRGVAAQRVAETLVGRFREQIGAPYVAAARDVGLSLREAVTLASMIEKETSLAEERPRISRVFHNRLALGMRMQCDPTVRYALDRAGSPVTRLTYRHLEFESPWNTYVVAGLPRGPIANPGLASLEAALRPAEGNELFFVAAPGGGHRFSESLAAHEAAVREWRAYSRSSSR